jgi:hypothetical protein
LVTTGSPPYRIAAENSTWIAPNLEQSSDGIATVYLANRVVPEHKIEAVWPGPPRRKPNNTA